MLGFKDRLDFARGVLRRLPKTGSLSAFAFAAVLVALGALLRFPLDQISQSPLPPYLTLYPAIVIAAFAGGIRVGVAAMVASAATAWLLWVAPPIPGQLTPDRIMTGFVFLFTGAITVASSGLARNFLDELALAEATRDQAARESVHRIKNLIAVVQAISRKISANAGDVQTYRDRLDARLNALATAQDMLIKRNGDGVVSSELVRSALAPFLPNPRLELVEQATAVVPSGAVTGLSMALYELATNSLKYGALASPNGIVRIETRRDPESFYIEWREAGLAHVAVGESAGLGSRLIRSALAALPDGSVRYTIAPQAVSCIFSWPDA